MQVEQLPQIRFQNSLRCCRWGWGKHRRSRFYGFGLIGLFAGFYLFVAFARSFFRPSRLEYASQCRAWNELFDIWQIIRAESLAVISAKNVAIFKLSKDREPFSLGHVGQFSLGPWTNNILQMFRASCQIPFNRRPCAHNITSWSFEPVSARHWASIVRDSMNSEMASGTMSRIIKVKNYNSFLAGHGIVDEFPKFAAFRAECHIGPLGCLKRCHIGPLSCLKRCHMVAGCLERCHKGPLSCLKRFSGIVTSSWHCMPLSIGNRTISQDTDNNQGLKKYLPPVSALLSAFIVASVIFYAFWIANFDDRD